MAICDAKYCFTIIDVGLFGKENDGNIFFFFKQLSVKINFPWPQCLLGDKGNTPQSFVIIGDEAFALHTNLVRPFPERSLTDKRRIFNYRQSKFSILSDKWMVFHTMLSIEPDFAAAAITYKACVFYNFIKLGIKLQRCLKLSNGRCNRKNSSRQLNLDSKRSKRLFIHLYPTYVFGIFVITYFLCIKYVTLWRLIFYVKY